MKNRSNFFYVYLHKRLDNDKIFYVGKGKGDRATTSKHRNEHWHNVVNKVGYRVVLLKEDLFEQEAFDLEISTIAEIGLDNLVNQTIGGTGGSPDAEVRLKISKALKGIPLSEETKLKMSKSRIGKKYPNRKPISEATKLKLSQSCVGKQMIRSINLITNVVNVYESIAYAVKSDDSIRRRSLVRALSGERNTYKNCKWEYLKC